jgi:hypothetical protein
MAYAGPRSVTSVDWAGISQNLYIQLTSHYTCPPLTKTALMPLLLCYLSVSSIQLTAASIAVLAPCTS